MVKAGYPGSISVSGHRVSPESSGFPPDCGCAENRSGHHPAARHRGPPAFLIRPGKVWLAPRRASRNPARMPRNPPPPDDTRLRIRIVFGARGMLGPGKAELLERIGRTGSIAAAGREMRMSYKRAWELIGTLNAMFRAPLVESTRGGPGGGGAVLTDPGREVLALYRAFEAGAGRAGAPQIAALRALLGDIPEGK